MRDLAATVAHVAGTGPVGTVGYCFGGSLAWLSASELPVDGGGRLLRRADPLVESTVIRRSRRCCTSASSITRIPLDQVEEIAKAHPEVEVHVYEGASMASTATPAARSTRSRPRSRSAVRSSSSSPTASSRDHRLPRALHDRAAAARPVPRRAEGGACAIDPGHVGEKGTIDISRRRAPRQPRAQPVAFATRARHSISRCSRRGRAGWSTTSATSTPRGSGREHCNDLIRRICDLYPDNFAPVCQLPQSPGASLDASVRELRRCVEEMGFVGCNLNPDPSGGYWNGATLADRAFWPLYEALCELDVPAMIHVSATCNPHFHTTGSHYLGCRHDSVHAGDDVRAVPRLPGDAVDHPARRRRGAVPLGPVQGDGRGERRRRLAHARRDDGERVVRHVRVPPAAGSTCCSRSSRSRTCCSPRRWSGAVKGSTPTRGQYYDDTRGVRRSRRAQRRATAPDLRASTCSACYPRLKIGA